MHLTETAYGDIAEYLLDTVSGRAVVDTAGPPRKRLESILTRSASDPLHKPMPGWIVGGNQGGACQGAGQHARSAWKQWQRHQREGRAVAWAQQGQMGPLLKV